MRYEIRALADLAAERSAPFRESARSFLADPGREIRWRLARMLKVCACCLRADARTLTIPRCSICKHVGAQGCPRGERCWG